MKDERKKDPKVLVISINSLTYSSSNGRALLSLLNKWSPKSIAQFYVNGERPDFDKCKNYYKVTDVGALFSLFGIDRGGEVKEGNYSNIKKHGSRNFYKKVQLFFRNTPLGYMIRNIIWKHGKGVGVGFSKWIDRFSPDAVLLQAGNYEFMFNIALKITEERKIPLIIYNSEDYYFKNNKDLFPMFKFNRKSYKFTFEKAMNRSSHVIYSNKFLEERFNKAFIHNSITLLTQPFIQPIGQELKNDQIIVSYLGNLGNGRHESLIEIAEELVDIDNQISLDIYGAIPNSKIDKDIKLCQGINYKGFVSYDEVIKAISRSDIIVHAESFTEFHVRNLEYAFSTKLADGLASGVPFLLYAPKSLAITRYVIEKDAAFVASSKKELKKVLFRMITDNEFRSKHINSALNTVKRDFDPNKTCMVFYEIIKDALDKGVSL